MLLCGPRGEGWRRMLRLTIWVRRSGFDVVSECCIPSEVGKLGDLGEEELA